MGKNVCIISTSLRKNGNSEELADEFARGAREQGHKVEKVTLYDKNIQFCIGCLSCQTTCQCVLKDDANDIIRKMCNSDVLVFASPIYFYEMTGQMKTLLDRTNPIFPAEYAFNDIYLLATAADVNESAMDGALKGLQGWIDCFEKARLAGVVRGTGVDKIGAIKNTPDILKQAYEMGKSI